MVDDVLHKLGLGTVQFGLDYGVSNTSGRTTPEDVEKILTCAGERGITLLDTAHLYGDSEEVLGRAIQSTDAFDIVTKTIPICKAQVSADDIDKVAQGFTLSLERLKRQDVYGVLLHDADDLKSKNAESLYRYLTDMKADGCVKKIGVSVYDNEQIDYILSRFSIDLIQIPMNVFDQRLIQTGALNKLKAHGVEVHVRSAFLQGLIFMDPKDVPANLAPLVAPLTQFQSMAKDLDVSFATLALSFLMMQEGIDKVVCGVNSAIQFEELINNLCSMPLVKNTLFSCLCVEDQKLVNPSYW